VARAAQQCRPRSGTRIVRSGRGREREEVHLSDPV